jgi:glycosyltransferase involved in cell wall biosynthesis
LATADPAIRPLLVTENFPPDRGGMAQSCDRITRGLRSRGVDLDVVHFTRRARHLHVERQHRGRLVRCPVEDDPSHAFNMLWTSWARHVSDRTHVLAFGGLLPVLAAPVYAAWMELPLVTLLRGNDLDTGIFSPRRGWALREALERSATVCTVSRDHESKLRRLLPSVAVELLPNGIDLSDWAILESDATRGREIRASFGVEGKRVVGVFGHLKRKKGVSLLLDAIARSNAAEQLHVLLVGEIDDDVAQQISELGDRPTTTRMPFLDRWELLPFLAACDLVAIPSLYDGMPNVLLEAGALGLPVLTSNAGGMADVLRDGITGIVFEAGDVHDARRAVETAAEMPAERLAIFGEAFRDVVRSEFTAERETSRYISLLERTAGPLSPGADAIIDATDVGGVTQ